MKKFTFLLSLLLLVVGVKASAQSFETSPAPTNGEWADGTKWYYVYSPRAGYWSSADSNLDASGNFKASSAVADILNEDTHWCVVGDETNGYTFYNKAKGVGYVLGTHISEARVRMFEAASVDASAVTTSHWRATSLKGEEWECFRIASDGTNYWNYSNSGEKVLTLWNNQWAVDGWNGSGGDDGSALKFEVVPDLSAAFNDLKTLVEDYVAVVEASEATYFTCPAEQLAILKAMDFNQEATKDIYVDYLSKYETAVASRGNTDLDGKTLFLGNVLHTTMFAYARTSDNAFGSSTELSLNSFWTFKKVSENTYTLYNEESGLYVQDLPDANNTRISLTADEASAYAYTVEASTVLGCIRLKGSKSPSYMHMVNWDGVVRWNADADASQFRISDATFSAISDQLLATIVTGTNWGDKQLTTDLNDAISALEGDKENEEKYQSLVDAYAAAPLVKVATDKFYTIKSTWYDPAKYLHEAYDTKVRETENQLMGSELGSNLVPNLWKFVPVTEEGNTDLYHIEAVNSGNYISSVTFGYTMSVVAKDAENAGMYDIYNRQHKDVDGAVTLVCYNADRSDRGTAKLNDNGSVQSWNSSGSSNNWYLEEVDEIPVAISAAGYATVNYPFAVTIPAGVKAYTGKLSDDEVVLTQVEATVLPANTPVVLEAAEGIYNFEIVYDNSDAPLADNDLIGANAPATVDAIDNAYILTNVDGVVKFRLLSQDTRTLQANKAHVIVPATAGSQAFALNFGGVTAIESIETAEADNAPVYDLSGRKVLAPQKGGIYVKNGKKIVF